MNKNIWSIRNCKISIVTFYFLALVINSPIICDFVFFTSLQIQIIASLKDKATKN